MDLSEKVVWITGASAGIGRALALELAALGADVAVSARRTDRLQELVRELEERGSRALSVPCDVTDRRQIEQAVETVTGTYGRLDIAVANAGFGVGGTIEELTDEVWRRQLEVNVVGLAQTARYALPHLRQVDGRMVLIGSVASMLPAPGHGAYAASKAAVCSIGATLSAELSGTGVSCTTIHPGFVESEIGRVDNTGAFQEEWVDRRPKRFMWEADRAAVVMAKAIYRRRREYVFTGHGKLGAFIGRHLPWLAHLVMRRTSD